MVNLPTKLVQVRVNTKFFPFVPILLAVLLVGCSSVNILRPANGSIFNAGQAVVFEGQITRSTETGGADRSDDLSWDSSLDGHIGNGRLVTTNTLRVGTHGITASWPNHNRERTISIQIIP
jgi:hypothetical protein